MTLSVAEENYIKAIHSLAQKGKVTTNILAERMQTKASSATDMLQRLGEIAQVKPLIARLVDDFYLAADRCH